MSFFRRWLGGILFFVSIFHRECQHIDTQIDKCINSHITFDFGASGCWLEGVYMCSLTQFCPKK
jgi:hypothetical protein